MFERRSRTAALSKRVRLDTKSIRLNVERSEMSEVQTQCHRTTAQNGRLLCALAWLRGHGSPTSVLKSTSEAVAEKIVLQMRNMGSDLLRGGLTHTAIRARWFAAGRARVMKTWEVRLFRSQEWQKAKVLIDFFLVL